ncbi:MAG TPA: hypothetical protein VFU88_09180 [Ktedonobacterales bacterium]|nr:hypothetical protein [Ktedonobacterales bacterium]
MSHVVSMRLGDDQMERLRHIARQLGRTPSETSALMVEEALRTAEFGHIQFRNTPAGRQAYVLGTGMAVWEIAMVARAFSKDAEQAVAHLELPLVKVQAALSYARAYPDEITAALDDSRRSFTELEHMLPGAQRVVVSSEAMDESTERDSSDTRAPDATA